MIRTTRAEIRDADVQIAPSTYYAAKSRPPSARAVRDAELTEDIRVVHKANLGVYDARKIHAALNREGVEVARCTVEQLMRAAGIQGIRRDKTRKTTFGNGGDRPARRPRQARVHRDGTKPALGCGPDLHPHPRRVDLRRVRPRRVQPSCRRLAGVHVAATDLTLDTLDMGLWERRRAGQDITALIHHRADPSPRCRSAVSSDSLHRAPR